MNNPFSSVYAKYISAKLNLARAKKQELEMRNDLISKCKEPKIEGAVTELIENFKIKYGFKVNRKVNKSELDIIWKELTQEEKDVIKFTPEVNITKYRKLMESNPKSKIFSVITEKPGQGDLSVEEVL